jgi:type IV pilus assembly protein PilB
MGLEPFNVAAALNCITAQRLLRRICKNCKEPHVYPEDVMESAKFPVEWAKKVTFYRGKGCDQCNGTGYKGRAGLYEVMAMSPALRQVIMRAGSVDDIRTQALKEGMLTLRMDGMVKIEKGVTTLEEVVKETAA